MSLHENKDARIASRRIFIRHYFIKQNAENNVAVGTQQNKMCFKPNVQYKIPKAYYLRHIFLLFKVSF